MTNKFQWDDSALVPESVEVNYPAEFKEDGSVKKTDKVLHFELARPDLVAFIADALDKNFIKEVEKEIDGEKKTVTERIPFREVEAEQSRLLFDGLAKSTRGKKDAEFFEKLEIGARGMDALVEMFFALNHIQEVTATGGNWLMLPTVRAISEAETAETKTTEDPSSESQTPTSEA
jgi:hypothetical protein